MSVSIGTSSAGIGPRHVMEGFGEMTGGKAFDWRVVTRLLTYLRPHWQRVAVAFLLMLIASALTLAAPYLIKVAIDQFIAQGDTTGLARTALLLTGVFIGIYLAASGQQYLLSWVGQQVLRPCAHSSSAISRRFPWAITITTSSV